MKRIDWAQAEAAAKMMSPTQLWGAILDANRAAKAGDELDRELGTDDGGYYRDQISVYRQELDARRSAIRGAIRELL
jgi:hypothetical protein